MPRNRYMVKMHQNHSTAYTFFLPPALSHLLNLKRNRKKT
jgi:hypothetical protein